MLDAFQLYYFTIDNMHTIRCMRVGHAAYKT